MTLFGASSSPVAATPSVRDKRQWECLRKRKYRAAKRSEARRLEAELKVLEDELWQLQRGGAATISAKTMQQKHRSINTTLRVEVAMASKLGRRLASWVATQLPPQEIPFRASWRHSTLMADPAARRHGYEWLCQRVYHTAIQFIPSHPFGNQVQDTMALKMHTGVVEAQDDVDGGDLSVVALETHVQYTVFSNFHTVAKAIWNDMVQDNGNFSFEVLDAVGDKSMYFTHINRRLGTTMRSLVQMFPQTSRIVIANVNLEDDECFPKQDGEILTHGFSWTILERVTSTITLVRISHMQFTPTTTHGVIPLVEIGRLFGRSAHGIEHREAYIEQIRTAATHTFVQIQQFLASELAKLVDHFEQELVSV
ncbi:Aste57867_12917 [Aphanomyces stellatus]|uniref:Aste57867_12917 protein n=1 Tax=Aphanomyces stellatus TaxID=120398 RepID=A0A485KX72_9STRA|nr:hypothetical protein As57867_012869 [Aphanomyces stellatus]VFT89763.1 Aste57867_12917 [Aphanomyces stellatus]